MPKKKIIFFIALLMLTFSGCIADSQVAIKLSPISTALNITSFNVSYKSTYSEPQNVTIKLETSDPRLGLSTSELDTFKQSLVLKEEVGSDYTNIKRIYIKVVETPIPPGNYRINATIEGEKSKNPLTSPPTDEMIVPVVP